MLAFTPVGLLKITMKIFHFQGIFWFGKCISLDRSEQKIWIQNIDRKSSIYTGSNVWCEKFRCLSKRVQHIDLWHHHDQVIKRIWWRFNWCIARPLLVWFHRKVSDGKSKIKYIWQCNVKFLLSWLITHFLHAVEGKKHQTGFWHTYEDPEKYILE